MGHDEQVSVRSGAEVRQWLESMSGETRGARLKAIRAEAIAQQLEALYAEDSVAVLEALKSIKSGKKKKKDSLQ